MVWERAERPKTRLGTKFSLATKAFDDCYDAVKLNRKETVFAIKLNLDEVEAIGVEPESFSKNLLLNAQKDGFRCKVYSKEETGDIIFVFYRVGATEQLIENLAAKMVDYKTHKSIIITVATDKRIAVKV